MAWKLSAIASLTQGALRGVIPADSVVQRFDTNPWTVGPDAIYVPLPSPTIDGHDLVVVAALRGARAALVRRTWADRLTELPLPLIAVDDPVESLVALASDVREHSGATVLGISGSVGKSSTTALVAAVLGTTLRTHHTSQNQNDRIGVSMTLLNAPEPTEVIALEMAGAAGAGVLASLAAVARPAVGVITNVHAVHTLGMGTVEAVARSKRELVEAMPSDGAVVLNGDDPRVQQMAPRAPCPVVTFGLGPGNDVRADQIETHGLEGCSFRLLTNRYSERITTPFRGRHTVYHVLAAVAVGELFSLDFDAMVAGIQAAEVDTRIRLTPGPNGSTVVDDSFNANRASMLAALSLLADIDAGRRIAVLGDMLELGSYEQREHLAVLNAAMAIVDMIVTCGTRMSDAAERVIRERTAGSRVPICSFAQDEHRALVDLVRSDLHAGDVVLVKGSHVMRMDRIARAISADGALGR